MNKHTIAAIATPYGKGALSIIRVSGDLAIVEINKIFKGKDLTNVEPNTIHYGNIYENDVFIDEVMIAVYHAPKSYTGEMMVEIFGHGGVIITEQVLKTILKLNIEEAKPGEFTERAYLNGKLDLIQAESIMDMIEAEHDYALSIAKHGLQSHISKKIEAFKTQMMDWIAHIEVNIDYPEYESEYALGHDTLRPQILTFLDEVNHVLIESKRNRLIREGIKTAIIGQPNVGKSSLLNVLINEEKAIVTHIPGTTRDVVEGKIQLKGLTLHLLDTAGIRKTDDHVESIGVEKSKQVIQDSQLVILVVDASLGLLEDDQKLLENIQHKPYIIVGNKVDLGNVDLPKDSVYLSAKNKTGIDALEKAILKRFSLENIETRDMNFLSNQRQIQLLEEAKSHIEKALITIQAELPIDMVQLDLRHAWEALSDISGSRYHESLVDDMFRKFCLGK